MFFLFFLFFLAVGVSLICVSFYSYIFSGCLTVQATLREAAPEEGSIIPIVCMFAGIQVKERGHAILTYIPYREVGFMCRSELEEEEIYQSKIRHGYLSLLLDDSIIALLAPNCW